MRKRALAGMMAVAGAIFLTLATVSSASASVAPDELEHPPASTAQAEGGEDYPQIVLDKIAELEAGGAEIIKLSTSEYSVEHTGTGVTTFAYPSGCGLTVIISKSGYVIKGDALTSCAGPFTALTHQDTLQTFNPDWGIWSTLRTGSKIYTSRSSGTSEIAYTCANTNRANYKTITRGTLTRGGNEYVATVYDQFDNNVLCGT